MQRQANGKYVRGVQGIRMSREVARNAAKVPSAVGKGIGILNIGLNVSTFIDEPSFSNAFNFGRSIASYFSLYYSAIDIYVSTFYSYIRQTQEFNLKHGFPMNDGLYLKGDIP